MKRPSYLHALIKAMTMSEKRHFKMNSKITGQKESPEYLKLFDAIEVQKEYDESKLNKKGRESAFAFEKNYLFESLLLSLNDFHKEKSVLIKIYTLLTSIEVCYSKGLFHQCDLLIQKARRLAHDFEKLSAALPLIRWEQLLLLQTNNFKKIAELGSEEQIILNTLSLHGKLVGYAMVIKEKIDHNTATPAWLVSTEKELKKLYTHESKRVINGYLTQYYYLTSLAFISAKLGNDRQRLEYYKQIDESFRQRPHLIKDVANLYYSNYNNLVNSLLFLEQYEEALENIHAQRNFFYRNKSFNQTLANQVLLNTYENELFLHCRSGNFDATTAMLSDAEQYIKNYNKADSNELYDLFLAISVAYYFKKEYRKTLRTLNKILEAGKSGIPLRKELYHATVLLFLITLAESEDILLNNRFRYFHKQLKSEESSKGILAYLDFIQISYIRKEKNKNQLAQDTLKTIQSITTEPLFSSANRLFDFPLWVYSIYKNTDIRKLYTAKKGGKGHILLKESIE